MRRVIYKNKKGKKILVNIPSYDLHYVNNQFGYGSYDVSITSNEPATEVTGSIVVPTGGSIDFNGLNRYFSTSGSSDWAVGTGNFTVEWFQYQTTLGFGTFPRIFTVGAYAVGTGINIGVTIENGTFYVWTNATATSFGTLSSSDVVNKWVHFAVTRTGTSLRVFKDGTQYGSTITNNTNITEASKTLYIGGDGISESNTRFPGYITNFHFVKGTSLYTGSFAVPTSPISSVVNTKLLLLAQSSGSILVDSSPINRTVTSTNPTFNSLTPFI